MAFQKGNLSWKGKKRPPFSEEWRRHISEGLRKCPSNFKGKHHTPESKLKNSIANKGKIPWNKGRIGVYSDEALKLMSEAKKGKPSPKRGITYPDEVRERMKQAHQNISEETRQLISKHHADCRGENHPMYGKHQTEEVRQRLSKTVKKLWRDPGYVKRVTANRIEKQKIKPNKAERELEALLQSNFPNTWKYVGDGQVWFGRKCPDFININGKKQIIELFGAYWHSISDIAKRVEYFKQYGFTTLVIWDDELKDVGRVLRKVKSFTRRQCSGYELT